MILWFAWGQLLIPLARYRIDPEVKSLMVFTKLLRLEAEGLWRGWCVLLLVLLLLLLFFVKFGQHPIQLLDLLLDCFDSTWQGCRRTHVLFHGWKTTLGDEILLVLARIYSLRLIRNVNGHVLSRATARASQQQRAKG